MQTAMNLESLLTTVIDQNKTKQDFVADTQKAEFIETESGLKIQIANPDQTMQFGITDNAHKQIAARLQIPTKHYFRILADYPEHLYGLVNDMFKKEPNTRMLRTLNGELRAFLSNSYKRLDHAPVLEHTLPSIINGDIETKLLSSNITDSKMYLKVLFPDDSLAQQIGITAKGTPDIIRPGFMLSNSETGHGSLALQAFFWRSFCDNGCHFGGIDAFNFKRSHLGGKLIEGVDFSIISDETRVLEDRALIGQTTDMLKAIASQDFSRQMGDKLRLANESEKVVNPVPAVELLAKEVGIRQSETDGVLESLIKDQNYSKWGMLNAVTEQANDDSIGYDRATELESIGSKILTMSDRQWSRIAQAEAA